MKETRFFCFNWELKFTLYTGNMSVVSIEMLSKLDLKLKQSFAMATAYLPTTTEEK